MKEFLFKKNLWILDLIASISFIFIFGFLLLRDSVTGKPNWASILYGVLSYFLTFILAIILQRKIFWLPSWIWLGIFGALIRIVFLEIICFPICWSSDILKVVAFNWVFWAIPCLIAIFAVRFLAYVYFLFSSLDIREKSIQRNNK